MEEKKTRQEGSVTGTVKKPATAQSVIKKREEKPRVSKLAVATLKTSAAPKPAVGIREGSDKKPRVSKLAVATLKTSAAPKPAVRIAEVDRQSMKAAVTKPKTSTGLKPGSDKKPRVSKLAVATLKTSAAPKPAVRITEVNRRSVEDAVVEPKTSTGLKPGGDKKPRVSKLAVATLKTSAAPKPAVRITEVDRRSIKADSKASNVSKKPVGKPAPSKPLFGTLKNGTTPAHVNTSAGNPSPASRSVLGSLSVEAFLQRFSEDKRKPKSNTLASARQLLRRFAEDEHDAEWNDIELPEAPFEPVGEETGKQDLRYPIHAGQLLDRFREDEDEPICHNLIVHGPSLKLLVESMTHGPLESVDWAGKLPRRFAEDEDEPARQDLVLHKHLLEPIAMDRSKSDPRHTMSASQLLDRFREDENEPVSKGLDCGALPLEPITEETESELEYLSSMPAHCSQPLRRSRSSLPRRTSSLPSLGDSFICGGTPPPTQPPLICPPEAPDEKRVRFDDSVARHAHA
ncbi:hypothetical protein P154DRAFT_71159 [Amniculicola lignicola CBS 123094]|uniref:Uncharacterized protein n=1 Tax=Amniculicola lignicola CBS 123094 TaxID=1392246 RepID=A0A6A5VWV7_9PLEO|nr:hypothetical protein P154DRAFT_71159 [Amniculicola lignicola CBS 123094]